MFIQKPTFISKWFVVFNGRDKNASKVTADIANIGVCTKHQIFYYFDNYFDRISTSFLVNV